MWTQTVPLFSKEHLRKTLLAAIMQFLLFFSAHGVYMWFPYILNQTMLYTNVYPTQGASICNIIRFTHSTNFTSNAATAQYEPFELSEVVVTAGDACISKLEFSTYKHTFALEIIYVCLILITIAATYRFDRTPILCKFMLTANF